MQKGFTRKPQPDDPATPLKNYITPSGRRRLKDEHQFLLTRQRRAVTEVVTWAASNGDRSENADYQYGKRRLRQIDGRILDLQKQIDEGCIHVLFDSPQELNIDAHFAKIVRTIEQHNIQRMVIDGMTSYSTALSDQAVYRDFFHALVAYSKHRLMATFFSYENPEFLGLSAFMPDFPVSSIVDNIILLSLVEINSSLRRCITVVKARGSNHEFDSREYVIGQGGITLLLFDENAAKALPLSSYASILSRAPNRLPARTDTR
jgi:circadian clock protein KaiC